MIESTGISEPMPVAATFDWEFEDGFSLGSLAKLDTMVTVVDASTFLGELAKGERLDERNLEAGEGDGRSISDLLVDQVEFADVILLNKTDLVSPRAAGTVEATLRRLNPTAQLIRTDHAKSPSTVSSKPVSTTRNWLRRYPVGARNWPVGTPRKPRNTEYAASHTAPRDPFIRRDSRPRSVSSPDSCGARDSAGSPVGPSSPRSGRRQAPTSSSNRLNCGRRRRRCQGRRSCSSE